MELILRRPDRLFSVLLRWMVVGLVSLTVQRLIFALVYGAQAVRLEPDLQVGAGLSIVTAYLTGLRFDLATLVIWTGPFALLLSLNAVAGLLLPKAKTIAIINTILFYLQWIWLLCLHLVSIASTYNYSVNGKHLGWEFAAYFQDLPVLVAGSFVKDPLATTLLALFIPLWLAGGVLLVRHMRRPLSETSIGSRWPVLLSPLLILILSLVLFRGGLQQNPLRPGDAMSESSPFLNNLKITGIYTIAHDLSDRGDFPAFYDEPENTAFIQNMLSDGRPFTDPTYPLLRRMEQRRLSPGRGTGALPFATEPGETAQHPNFIVLLMESWSAKFTEAHGYGEDVTPNFNRLVKQGVYFDHFYASGGRSANGLFSILTGIPDRAGRTILRSSRIFNRFGSLPLLLKGKGYQTHFVHGGDLHFDNLDTGLPHLGFDQLTGMKEMEASGRYSRRWTMGFHDEDMYDMLLRKTDEAYAADPKRPFFAMAFTSNNHHPFGLPDPSFAVFPDSDPESAFKNSYHYADFALGKFVDFLKTRPYYRNTIVLIVADHTHHANLDYLQDREIPLLVYAPSLFQPTRRSDVAGQLDLLPTVLSLAGGGSDYAAMGRDLTAPTKQAPFAFFAGGSNTDIIGMISEGFIYYHYLRSSQAVLLKGTHPAEMRDVKAENPALFAELDAKTKHYYQFARTIEKENRIWPEGIIP